ncbi:hypothetical protein NQ317_016514 [Molorchus minor]|uniref:Uncharacterized protein n=1 Tax=Molorchus minor TaxID=1323400 RepID=A0ABQ9JDW3_9CUCU|nr:hypothetical protein NQ317_016514 [Molorchus minor]
MESDPDDSFDEEKIPTTKCLGTIGLSPSLVSGPKKWSPRSLQDTETPVPQVAEIEFPRTRWAKGAFPEQDILTEENVDVCDKNDLTALHWACAYGQFSTVQLLLKYGANVNTLGPEKNLL